MFNINSGSSPRYVFLGHSLQSNSVEQIFDDHAPIGDYYHAIRQTTRPTSFLGPCERNKLPIVSPRADSFFFFKPPICWGSSNSMTSFLICMLTTRRSAATHLRRMSCSCRSGFRDAWMKLQNGCDLIVNSTQPRRSAPVHPFDNSIRFHSPVCVSESTSLFRPILSETSEYIWTVTSA